MINAKVKALIAWADRKDIDLDEAHIECGAIEFFQGHYERADLVEIQAKLGEEGCVFNDVHDEYGDWPGSELTIEGTPWRVLFYKDKSPLRVGP